MRRFAALVHKEIRDHAVVLALCSALAPAVSWPVQRWVFKFSEPEWTAWGFVPLLVGIFVVLVASDLFATDLATRRMDALALLPVSLRVHWTARAVFVALAGAALTAWTFACQAAILACWAKPGVASDLWHHMNESTCGLSEVALVGAGVLFVSAMGYGGFRAAVFGSFLATLVFVAALLVATTKPLEGLRYVTRDETLSPALAGAATLVVASYTAFVRGRPHVGVRRRVLAWGAAPVLALVVPGAAIAGVRIHEIFTLEPGTSDVWVRGVVPSPDGRLLAVSVCRGSYSSLDTGRTWVVRVADGALFAWSPRGENLGGWTKDGLLVTWRNSTAPMGESSAFGMSVRRPETGEVVHVPTSSEWCSGDLCVGDRWRNRWINWGGQPPNGRGMWQLTNARDGRPWKPVFSNGLPTPCDDIGVVLRVTADGALVRTNLDTRVDETLVARGVRSTLGSMGFSPDLRFVAVGADDGDVVLDSTTWARVAGPWKDRGISWSIMPGPGAVLVLTEGKSSKVKSVLDVATKRETPIEVGYVDNSAGVAPLPDGRVAVRHDETVVDLLGADGKFIRRLYPPDR